MDIDRYRYMMFIYVCMGMDNVNRNELEKTF